ncbi:MAG TPA: bifunctional homocysteine S-methyltransferase/methylenetetrahydrofolate reductase, partial [Candidatus Desulfofervidus auxilii]|nr:bifunctional homocysteine S-methyltransferase/methylenetetrahydrofolate reductase [Candidatus Desulfofervidus auxilii]
MMSRFIKTLDKNVLVCDGAMGTMLYRKGIYINTCFDEVNLSAPELVKEIHLSYTKAGVDILSTNTFGANYWHLKNYGLEKRIADINRAAVKIAKDVASKELFIAGTIGPLSPYINPPFKEEDFYKGYEIQVKT